MPEKSYNAFTVNDTIRRFTAARFRIASLAIGILLFGLQPVAAAERGDAERGRAVFNGKGICYYCHGTDGRLDQRPSLSKETAGVIARLAPNPPDLRNLKGLRLKNDRERFRAIREGHPGTGMLPDRALTDQEITDALAYLAALRRE